MRKTLAFMVAVATIGGCNTPTSIGGGGGVSGEVPLSTPNPAPPDTSMEPPSSDVVVAPTVTPAASPAIAPVKVTVLAGGKPDPRGPSWPTGGSADGKGEEAKFNGPSAICIDASGNLYVVDTAMTTEKIRKITPDGVVTTIATIPEGFSISPEGGMAADPTGNLFVAHSSGVLKVTPSGTVSNFAGGGESEWGYLNGKGSDARFRNPHGVAIAPSGKIYLADLQNNAIRSLSANGSVETLAGAAKFDSEGASSGGGIAGDADGTGTQARFRMPTDLALDSKGRLFVTDSSNNAIRIIAANGTVTTWMKDRPDGRFYFQKPSRIAIDDIDNVYILDVSDRNILKITPQRKIYVLYEYSTEQLWDIAVDPRGTVYVTDGAKGRILKIEPR